MSTSSPGAGNLDAQLAAGVRRIAVQVRDPRQALISFLFVDIVKSTIPERPPLGREEPWNATEYYRAEVQWLSEWAEVEARPPAGLEVRLLSFEELIGGYSAYFHELWSFFGIHLPVETIGEALEGLKAPGSLSVGNFRKGATDEWRGVISPKERERMWELMPKDLAGRFGWQP